MTSSVDALASASMIWASEFSRLNTSTPQLPNGLLLLSKLSNISVFINCA
uniref:Uncharacterized protein n=1 Tax=Arundo donax TaxID=35708 RepID=A0A0A9C5N0_ARUDO